MQLKQEFSSALVVQVVPVEHVQLSKVENSCHTKWHSTQSMCLSGVAAKPTAKPAVGEPIPVTPVEHVQLFKVEYSHQEKWHTKHVSQRT